MSKIHWLITDQNITVNYEGQTHIVPRADALADKLIKAVKENRLKEIPTLVSAAKRVEAFSNGHFTVKDGTIFVNGVAAPSYLGNKILAFSSQGLPYQPLVKFAEKLQKNPSYRAVNELFQFLEKNDHPITENGNFIAYKKVKPNFKDIHSGKFDNSPGTFVSMPRNEVDEDPTRTCSKGLHVANWDYAYNYFGSSTDTMIEVEVDPADVVAVPIDYNQSKMRTCGYKVLGVVDKEHSSSTALRVTNQPSNFEDYECEDIYCAKCGDIIDSDDDLCIHCSFEYEDTYPWEDELDG